MIVLLDLGIVAAVTSATHGISAFDSLLFLSIIDAVWIFNWGLAQIF